jgi:SAM-dependent methyltransferase
VEWLVGTDPVSVLELGAGTGKLTEVLVELGHDVFATDPDDRMLDILSRRLPDVRATVGSAEQIPVPDRSYDVVVAGQSFHWFDLEKALPEIARVLRPEGRIALVWNLRDERIPWVRRLSRLLGRQDSERTDLVSDLDESAMFSAIDDKVFRHWHVVDRETIQDLMLSRSHVAALDPAAREDKVREILAFYDDFGRGMDGMQLPYNATCFRASILPHAQTPLTPPVPEPIDLLSSDPADGEGGEIEALARRMTDTAERLPRVVTDDGPDTEMILIDFR